jgi:hypothetical protein
MEVHEKQRSAKGETKIWQGKENSRDFCFETIPYSETFSFS